MFQATGASRTANVVKSGMPNNVIHDGKSILRDFVAEKMGARYQLLVNDMKQRLAAVGTIKGAQNGGGIYTNLLKAELKCGDVRRVNSAIALLNCYVEYINCLTDKNLKSGQGKYIPQATKRVPDGGDFMNVVKNATSVAKTVITAVAPVDGRRVVDCACGNGNLLDHFKKVSNCSFAAYVGIDSGRSGKHKSFDDVVSPIRASFKSITLVNDDVNVWLSDKHANSDIYFAVNSHYYLDSHIEKFLLSSLYYGVVNVSDLLFVDNDFVSDDHLNLTYDDAHNAVSGHIAGFEVEQERLVLSTDFLGTGSMFYPGRFVHSIRKMLLFHSIYFLNSIGLIMPRPPSQNIAVSFGKRVRLLPTDFSISLKRPSLIDLSPYDLYFYQQTGFYVSEKLNGVAMFLSRAEGKYYVYSRNGDCFTPTPLDGDTLNFGDLPTSLFCEVIRVSPDVYEIYFVSECFPPKFDKNNCNNWRSLFTPWFKKVERIKLQAPSLFFKEYTFVDPGLFDPDKPPSVFLDYSFDYSDGVIITCPFGAASHMVRPFNTFDVLIEHLDGVCVMDTQFGKLSKPVSPPGLFECYSDNGMVCPLADRHDKIEASTKACSFRNELFF